MPNTVGRDVASNLEGHFDFSRTLGSPSITYEAGETIYRAGERATLWYRLLTGAARKYWLALDGRRHIVDFLGPGDIFGLTKQPNYVFGVDALVSGTTCVSYEHRTTDELSRSNPQLAKLIHDAAFDAIARLQKHVVMLGSASMLEKLSSFILDLEERNGPITSGLVYLPMSRTDIADYLSAAPETVSRTLAELRDRRLLSLRGVRCIRICNRSALQALARSFCGFQK